jgi:hypothetical protein
MISSLTFCCEGKEYSALSLCLGYVSAIHGPGTACYHEALESSGSCTSASMPDGAPSGHLDEGSVAPGVAGLSSSSGGGALIHAKLGRCGRCIQSSLALAAASWLAFLFVPAAAWLTLVPAVFLTVLFAAHAIAYVARQPWRSGDCGCGKPATIAASSTL